MTSEIICQAYDVKDNCRCHAYEVRGNRIFHAYDVGGYRTLSKLMTSEVTANLLVSKVYLTVNWMGRQ